MLSWFVHARTSSQKKRWNLWNSPVLLERRGSALPIVDTDPAPAACPVKLTQNKQRGERRPMWPSLRSSDLKVCNAHFCYGKVLAKKILENQFRDVLEHFWPRTGSGVLGVAAKYSTHRSRVCVRGLHFGWGGAGVARPPLAWSRKTRASQHFVNL